MEFEVCCIIERGGVQAGCHEKRPMIFGKPAQANISKAASMGGLQRNVMLGLFVLKHGFGYDMFFVSKLHCGA